MVVNDDLRVFVCETVTGRITADLPPASVSVGQRLNGPGAIELTLRPGAAELAGLNLKAQTMPLAQSLGVSYRGRVLECGPILKRGYDDGELKLSAAGQWWIFNKRKAVSGASLLPGAPVTQSDLVLRGSLGDIARELVRLSIEDNPYGGRLPIVLPPLQGGTSIRTYQGYDLAQIGDRLKQLTEVRNGPDIRFRPRFSGSDPKFVEWVMECGTPSQPLLQQTGADWVWDGSVEQSGVESFTTEEDGEDMASMAWVPGAGQERSMLVATARTTELVDQGIPWTESDVATKSIEDLGLLQGYAERLLAEGLAPWSTVGLKVRAGVDPVLGTYLPGDWATVIVPGDHPTLAPGPTRVRIMAVDFDGTETVSLTIAPLQTSIGGDSRGTGQETVDSDSPVAADGTWSTADNEIWAQLPPGTWKEV